MGKPFTMEVQLSPDEETVIRRFLYENEGDFGDQCVCTGERTYLITQNENGTVGWSSREVMDALAHATDIDYLITLDVSYLSAQTRRQVGYMFFNTVIAIRLVQVHAQRSINLEQHVIQLQADLIACQQCYYDLRRHCDTDALSYHDKAILAANKSPVLH